MNLLRSFAIWEKQATHFHSSLLFRGFSGANGEPGGMDYFLGIDAGGTKTAAVIADAAGTERGRGAGGPCSLATGDYPQWTRAVRDAARTACRSAGLPEDTRFQSVCAGVAGYSMKAKRVEFAAILAEEISADSYDITPDYEIAYWGASGGEPGIVVIAGTGSVAFGRNAQGETHKVGGLGYILGDTGSGFELGKMALHQAIKSLRQERKFPLADAVLAHIGAETSEDILEWTYQDFSPAKIAALAPIIGKLADEGDGNARAILSAVTKARHSGNASRLIHKLRLPHDAPVYRLGGIWLISAYLRSLPFTLSRSLEEADLSLEAVNRRLLNLREPRYDAAMGAALFARHRGEGIRH